MASNPETDVELKNKASGDEETDDDGEEYEAERICDKRTVNGQLEYLIKWKGAYNVMSLRHLSGS